MEKVNLGPIQGGGVWVDNILADVYENTQEGMEAYTRSDAKVPLSYL